MLEIAVTILGISAAVSGFLSIRFARALIVSISVSVLILLTAGLIDQLILGRWLTLAFGVSGSIVALVRIIRRKDYGALIPSPSLVLWVVLSLGALTLKRDQLFSKWDEFSHWGTVVKAMVVFEKLPPLSDAILNHSSYPPGASLWAYLVGAWSAPWQEGTAYWAYALIVLSIFAAVWSSVTWRWSWRLLLLAPISLLFPQVFFDYSNSLKVDALLGLLFGYLLFLVFSEKKYTTKFLVEWALNGFLLTFFKDSGIFLFVLAGLVLLFQANRQGFFSRRDSGSRRMAALGLTPIVFPLMFYWIWRQFLESVNTRIAFQPNRDLITQLSIARDDRSSPAGIVIDNFYAGLFEIPLAQTATPPPLTAIHWFLIVGICVVLIIPLLAQALSIPPSGLALLTVFFGAVLWAVGLELAYLTRFTEYEAVRLASMGRYLSTYVLGVTILALFMAQKFWIDLGGSGSKKRDRNFWLTSLGLVILGALALTLIPPRTLLNPFLSSRESTSIIREPYQEFVNTAASVGIGEDSSIIVISQYTTGYDHKVLRYLLMGSDIADYWSIGTPYGDDDVWTRKMDLNTLELELDNYEYLMVYKTDASLDSDFGGLLPKNQRFQNNSVYLIHQDFPRLELLEPPN